MKKIALLLFLTSTIVHSQTYSTSYSGYEGGTCYEEEFTFTFRDNFVYKKDLYYNTVEKIPAKIHVTGFSADGYFYEGYSPLYYLDEVGVTEFMRSKQDLYFLFYDRKGGDLLFILEVNGDNTEIKRFYYNQKGYQIFCK